MAIKFDELDLQDKKKVMNLIEKKTFIDFIADVEYQCYYEKITEEQFFEREFKLNDFFKSFKR